MANVAPNDLKEDSYSLPSGGFERKKKEINPGRENLFAGVIKMWGIT
jgi:hypothetical protein